MKKAFFIFSIFVITLISCYGNNSNSAFAGKIYLNYHGLHFTLGKTTIDDVEKLLGKPDEIERSEYGGEGFYWENLIIYDYKKDKLSFIFSGEKNILIRIVFLPIGGNDFSTFSHITQKSKRDDLVSYFTKLKYDISYASNSTTFWVTFYSSKDGDFEVVGGFQFDDNDNLTGLNYFANKPWW